MNTAIVTERIAGASPRFKARIAGPVPAHHNRRPICPFAFAPSGMMPGDAALPTTKALYVLGGAAQLIVYTCDIGVALIFYELLRPVSRSLAC